MSWQAAPAVAWLRETLGEAVAVRAAAVDIGTRERLVGVETLAVARAVPKRVREFAAGRHLARLAFEDLALPFAVAIPRGEHGAPVWPPGLVGSIAHDARTAVAVVARSKDVGSLGVDIEGAAPLREHLWSSVLSVKDIIACETLAMPIGEAAKRVFSAKEAVYKAQFFVTRCAFGFEGLSIRFGPNTASFVATFEIDALPFARGDTVAGSVARFDDTVVSAVVLDRAH